MDALVIEDLTVGPLRKVSLTVQPGEIVCLSGPSGSGKSRLLRAVADLEAHGGDALIGHDRQSGVAAHHWRGWVMLVPAESAWWAETVAAHFVEPLPGSLDGFGLSDSVLAWEVSRLSSGEKQRLAVLRALSLMPRALLLDEPTANLDGDTTRRVETWLRDYAGRMGIPVLWVAHDPAQIERVAHRHFTIRGEALREIPCRVA
ncbi:ABC-type iron transport system FetAB ATPase subunit [Natronocella acetinitrilica]|uniref:ABC-type iron transport system FetAB ATPase subunit n=1 Tax=Natronocella acetinitrilica TaxID=414046 RepID=A0AAE3KCF2_9GAMM|nr:ATP-binding cassette domain-containing protein [Natronocella acetinitrilica]MCP1676790.1 ABC-type iron transport system FetAB ATPase subunit [Natronocella acetinitrilica]